MTLSQNIHGFLSTTCYLKNTLALIEYAKQTKKAKNTNGPDGESPNPRGMKSQQINVNQACRPMCCYTKGKEMFPTQDPINASVGHVVLISGAGWGNREVIAVLWTGSNELQQPPRDPRPPAQSHVWTCAQTCAMKASGHALLCKCTQRHVHCLSGWWPGQDAVIAD